MILDDAVQTGSWSTVNITNRLSRTIIVGCDVVIPPGETRPLPSHYTCYGSIDWRYADGESDKR